MRSALFKNLTLTATAFVLALLMAEGGLRLAGYSDPPLYRMDPHTGAAHRPGVTGWWTSEGHGWIRINADGIRGPDLPLAKPDGVYRIAVLGDSYTQGLQVNLEDTFPAVLERELSRRGCAPMAGKQVQAINFGVSGYGTAQELLTLRHKVWQYDPDLVILAFLTGNDVRNNLRELDGEPIRPYFVLQDGKLVLDDRFLHDPGYLSRSGGMIEVANALSRRSRLLQLIRRAALNLRAKRLMEAQEAKRAGAPAPDTAEGEITGAGLAEAGLDEQVYGPPSGPEWEKAWAVTEQLVIQMQQEVTKRGARFLLATLSNGAQVNPDPEVRARYAERLEVPDLWYPDRRMAALAERQDIPFVMLGPQLAEWAEANGTCVHGFENASPCGGHWNETGHHLAGQGIADAVCRIIDPQGAS